MSQTDDYQDIRVVQNNELMIFESINFSGSTTVINASKGSCYTIKNNNCTCKSFQFSDSCKHLKAFQQLKNFMESLEDDTKSIEERQTERMIQHKHSIARQEKEQREYIDRYGVESLDDLKVHYDDLPIEIKNEVKDLNTRRDPQKQTYFINDFLSPQEYKKWVK